MAVQILHSACGSVQDDREPPVAQFRMTENRLQLSSGWQRTACGYGDKEPTAFRTRHLDLRRTVSGVIAFDDAMSIELVPAGDQMYRPEIRCTVR